MFYIYFVHCYFKRPISRTGVQNNNNPGESKFVFTFISPNVITTVSRWINNRLNCWNWQRMPLFTKSLLEVFQRLVLYKTSARLGFIGKKKCADQFIVCWFPDTNVAGLDTNVALILELRTVGVDGYYVLPYPQPVNPSLWAYGTNVHP